MNNIKQVFHNYQEYFEKFINILETYSDDLIFEKFLTDKEINQVIDKYQVVSLIRGHVYESRNINNRILEEINQWDSDQLTFFLNQYNLS